MECEVKCSVTLRWKDPYRRLSYVRLLLVLLSLLSLSYHRCLRMISEAIELYVDDERVCQSWCMFVVSHGYGGLGGQGWRWWMVCMPIKAIGVGRMLEDSRALRKCEVMLWWLPITPPSRCAVHGSVELELVCLLGKDLTWDAMRRTGSLSLQLVGYTPWCSSDAVVVVE